MEQAQHEPGPLEYQSAMRTVRCVKNVLLVLVMLTIAAQLTAAFAVHYGHVVDVLRFVDGPNQPRSEHEFDRARMWDKAMCAVLPTSRFVAIVSCGLLAMTMALALNLVLVGRLGGARGMIGAFFWTLLLLATLVPWQEVLPSLRYPLASHDWSVVPVLPCSPAIGAIYDTDELIRAYRVYMGWTGKGFTGGELAIYYLRFFAYPGVALLIAVVAQLRFAAGWRKMMLPPDLTIQAPTPKA